MKILKRFIKKFVKHSILYFYNRKHSTKIYSLSASIKAKYGSKVLISDTTVVEDNVKIGNYSYVNRGSYIENCTIGNFCSISSGVYISPFEHDYKLRTTHPIVRLNQAPPSRPQVHIGNDVLISLNAVILEGVRIGNGAVIGAGAVVTKDVKPYEIVGGVPAKHIKYRFSPEEIDYLEDLKWWDWDIEKIKRNIDFLSNKTNTIK
ncbi:CatB-related O-acetyltransferase [Neobacillus niacini]|uniref:CatB-related O-acetyltransferase n=1 Tax=Neobacillus niacini TaxID=86668 RepID=UPI003000AD69